MAANSRFAVATHIMALLAHTARNASDPSDVRVKSEWIAGSVNTNPVVVRRTLSDLAKAKLVLTHQGKSGGVELARAPERITLAEIYAAVEEGELFALNPNAANPDCIVSRKMVGVLKPVFSDVQAGLLAHLRKVKLSDVVRKFA